jgi:hypothetical protein
MLFLNYESFCRGSQGYFRNFYFKVSFNFDKTGSFIGFSHVKSV